MKKVIMLFIVFGFTLNLIAQKRINLDTLNVDQLNLYRDKAIKLRNAGRIVTFTGLGILTVGLVSSMIWTETFEGESGEALVTLVPAVIGIYVGIPTAFVGLFPLWSTGANRKSKAEIALKKFNIVPENSMALGLGITINF
jgi:glycopeptide antibiotics resistance protein